MCKATFKWKISAQPGFNKHKLAKSEFHPDI